MEVAPAHFQGFLESMVETLLERSSNPSIRSSIRKNTIYHSTYQFYAILKNHVSVLKEPIDIYNSKLKAARLGPRSLDARATPLTMPSRLSLVVRRRRCNLPVRSGVAPVPVVRGPFSFRSLQNLGTQLLSMEPHGRFLRCSVCWASLWDSGSLTGKLLQPHAPQKRSSTYIVFLRSRVSGGKPRVPKLHRSPGLPASQRMNMPSPCQPL